MKLTRQLLTVGLALLWSATLASAIPGRAEVKGVVGPATVTKAAGGSTPLTAGMVLGAGDTITTGPAGWVDLWLGLNGEALRLTPETTLKLEVLDIAHIGNRHFTTRLKLTQGRLLSLIQAKPSAASRLEIFTPNYRARVDGRENTGSSFTTQIAAVLSGRLLVRRVGLGSSDQDTEVLGGYSYDGLTGMAGPMSNQQQGQMSAGGGGGLGGGGGGGLGGLGGMGGGLRGFAGLAGLAAAGLTTTNPSQNSASPSSP